MSRFLRIILVAMFVAGGITPFASCAPKKEVRPTVEAAPEEAAPGLPAPFLDKEAPEAAPAEEAPVERRPRPLAARLEGKDADKQIILNFENADIKTVIETVGDILGLNYILSPGISGQVTIQSNNKFPVKDLFSVFQAVLEMNNLTAVKEGHFYTILPVDQAKGLPLEVEKGKDIKFTLDSQLVTQIISIEYVKAADASNILKNLLPRGADVVVYEPTNLLIVTARPNALRRIMKILDAVDIAETETEAMRTFVYYVEHGEAKSLAEILKTIYEDSTKAGATKRAPVPAASRRRSTAARRKTPTARTAEVKTPSTTTITGTLTGEVIITAYEDINAIIIKATPKSYLTIVDSLKKLDVPRKQVLIDVTVAEVTLDKELEFGVQWALKTQGVFGTESATGAAGFSAGKNPLSLGDIAAAAPGVFAAVLDPGKVTGLIQALDDRSLVKLISNPSVLATDTKEARIEVGRDVPTATGNVVTDTTSINTVGQIQYRKTGAILDVTPYVNSKNRVTLKISQEISNVLDLENAASGINSPTFSNRTAKTTAVIEDGHSLVIGGLISEDKTRSRTGIPILMDIPILGYLFGSTSWVTSRTEFLIIVTPHIVTSVEDADYITEEYKSRVHTIQKRIDIEGDVGIK